MNSLRNAAQAALEALEWHLDRGTWGADIEGVTGALRAALAEPVQEPVALVRTWRKNGRPHAELLDWGVGVAALPDGKHTLYTAPPQRKPLTDEKVCDLWSWSMTTEAERTATTQQHAFARAIERAHGIGGQE